MVSPTSRLRKELRRRRRAAQKGSKNLSASARKAPHTPVSPVLKHRKPKSFTTTRKTKPSSQQIDRSKTPLITCWSSSDDSTAGWVEMKERIRFKNALRQKNQLNPNDIDWGSSSSEDEGFSVKLERMKLEQSAKKGSRRALREDVGSLERAFGSLGFDNYQQSQREHVNDSKSNHQRSNITTSSLGKESSYPDEPGQLDEHELQVYNSLKLKLRGGTYDSNRTLCELIRRRKNDTSFASREMSKNNEAVMQDLKLVWGIGPHRASRFGEEMLYALESKENKRLLKLSRKNGLIRLGDKIDAAMERLEDGTRKQSKGKHCIECYDGDDDEYPKLPRYIAFDSQMGTL